MKKILITLLIAITLLGAVKTDPPFPVPTRKPTKTPKVTEVVPPINTPAPTIIYIVVTATPKPTVTNTLTPTVTDTLEPTITWTATPTVEEPVEEPKSNTGYYVVGGFILVYLGGLTFLVIKNRRKDERTEQNNINSPGNTSS